MNEKAKMLLTALSENRITLKLALAYMDSPLEGEALKAILDAHTPASTATRPDDGLKKLVERLQKQTPWDERLIPGSAPSIWPAPLRPFEVDRLGRPTIT